MTNLLSEASTLGWALRHNGSCLSHEQDCGPTANPYRACCPGGSYCPAAYNIACCPSRLNCTDALQARPACANTTWDLYYNGGYFCCGQGTRGYATSFDTNGCGEQGYRLKDTETLLAIIATGMAQSGVLRSTTTAKLPTSTVTPSEHIPSTATSTSTSTNLPPPPPRSNGSDTNVGAIAGAAVGGAAAALLIVALVWFICRRRRRTQKSGERGQGLGKAKEERREGFGVQAADPRPHTDTGIQQQPVELAVNFPVQRS
ncbi:hypothetical protein BJY04DRAFT_222375 [Aspergillus karnatakaensis]|uniref:uncharacterized protein n=1 Tax=Aspergillus karnatakaensis TaxID=1810916 RepID=UPI003CCCA5C5